MIIIFIKAIGIIYTIIYKYFIHNEINGLKINIWNAQNMKVKTLGTDYKLNTTVIDNNICSWKSINFIVYFVFLFLRIALNVFFLFDPA